MGEALGVYKLGELKERIKEIKGVPTGIDGLDELFFTFKRKGNSFEKIPLGGIPQYAVLNLTGVSDTGKSLMAEQFAVWRAGKGDRVAFVTVETPAPFLSAGLYQRTMAYGIETSVIDENIIILDAASYKDLRENLPTLFDSLAYVYRTYKADYTVIDSVTGLYEHKEIMARIFVRQIFNFLKKWYQTGILVSQKRSSHEELSAEAAGGYAVSHIVDCTIVLSKKTIQSTYDERLYKKPIGELIRLFRIDGCRMCGHDTDTHILNINDMGLVSIGPSLKEVLKNKKEE